MNATVLALAELYRGLKTILCSVIRLADGGEHNI